MIYVNGQLLDPMNIPQACANIRVEALTNQVALSKSTAITQTTKEGFYDFMLVEGTHRVEINYTNEYQETGDILITPEMDGNTYTLPEIMVLAAVVEPEPEPEPVTINT